MGTGTTTYTTLTRALHRIDKLEAARRRVARSLSRCTPGSALAADLSRQSAELEEQLSHWRCVVAQAEAAGLKIWSAEDFSRGDYVEYRGAWHEVLRVNRRSVTVPRADDDPAWTWTIGYHDGITGRMSAEEMAELSQDQGPKDHNE